MESVKKFRPGIVKALEVSAQLETMSESEAEDFAITISGVAHRWLVAHLGPWKFKAWMETCIDIVDEDLARRTGEEAKQ